MNPPPIIALLTDFGLNDAYVGIMKGVLLSRLPAARIVDITHDVPPQDVLRAAFLLETAWPYFPAGTVFVVVCDPGVGSARRRIAVQRDGRTFIGPDNGCLSAAIPDASRGRRDAGEHYVIRETLLTDSSPAVLIESTAVIAPTVSATFEGRDVFAPAAAFLAAGGSFAELGHPPDRIMTYPAFRASEDGATVNGVVIHVDRYGNAITDIRSGQVLSGTSLLVAGPTLPFVRTYADVAPGDAAALIGSSGFLEVAVRDGSAARKLGIGVGSMVVIEGQKSAQSTGDLR